jgi:hypothetical protein
MGSTGNVVVRRRAEDEIAYVLVKPRLVVR